MTTTIEFFPNANIKPDSRDIGRVKICSGNLWVNASVRRANNPLGYFIAHPADKDKNDPNKYWPKSGFIDKNGTTEDGEE